MNMERAQYIQWSAGIFALIAAVHVWRLFAGWEAIVAGWPVPLWVNGIAFLIAGYLAYQGWRLSR